MNETLSKCSLMLFKSVYVKSSRIHIIGLCYLYLYVFQTVEREDRDRPF